MISVQQSVYMNLYILALADGRVDMREADFLSRFAFAAHISEAQQREWQALVQSQQLQFVPVASNGGVAEALALFARMVRVDDEFVSQEQEAYLLMGKALGYSDEELGNALRTYWNEDPSFDMSAIFAPDNAPAPNGQPRILVISDDQSDLERLERSANQCSVVYCHLAEAGAHIQDAHVVLFQAADDPKASLARLEQLKRIFTDVPVAFIARRDQAAQIGYLLESGADKCFVKPLFQNELNKAMHDLLQTQES
ncbi:MAG: response regulator transcription factor [Deltaproteobacteria bacterium]|nr:response regulator transcription factor [Deltaproteobacteria bacterium]